MPKNKTFKHDDEIELPKSSHEGLEELNKLIKMAETGLSHFADLKKCALDDLFEALYQRLPELKDWKFSYNHEGHFVKLLFKKPKEEKHG